jgi:hypothetical protein
MQVPVSQIEDAFFSDSEITTVKAAVDEFGPKDYLVREENPRKELLTWQA